MNERLRFDPLMPREVTTFDDDDRRAYLGQPRPLSGKPEPRPEPAHCRRCDDDHREFYRARFPVEG